MSIELFNIKKRYGNQVVLPSLSMSVGSGEIVGFLGPNGAGKSTTMKIITGFVVPDSGSVSVCGVDMLKNPIEAKRRIGYLPEHNPLYPDMYVREYLDFVAGVYKIPSRRARVDEVIEQVGLTSEYKKTINSLSKGYRQRTGLAAAIVHNPDVLILDEPTTGLDPNQIIEIRELIKSFGKERTVLFSTHIMQEVEAVCDRFIILNKGTIMTDKKVSDIERGTLENLFRTLTLDPNYI
ncbi:MAG: ATP-binding cassette domain-containing protein [Paludibacteraceae bacterium]|nr:ATP-binding cassette domain-containing protein [Paludibacteraceae bacterium]